MWADLINNLLAEVDWYEIIEKSGVNLMRPEQDAKRLRTRAFVVVYSQICAYAGRGCRYSSLIFHQR